MSPDLFRSIVEGRRAARSTRYSALPASLIVHVLVVIALVVIPLLATDVLPDIADHSVFTLTPVALPVPRPVVAVQSQGMPIGPAGPRPIPLVSPDGISAERLILPPSEDLATTADIVPGLPEGSEISAAMPEPPPAAATPLRVSALKVPVKINDVLPVYPEAARLARVEGIVVIEAVIGTTGEVIEARVLRSVPLLDAAALAAVRQWRYTPTVLGGVPVTTIVTVTVCFKLR